MSVLRLPQLSATAGKQTWGNLPGAALSLAIAEAASSAGRFTLLLTADSQAADRLEQELRFFAPDLPVLPFPDWETLPYDLFSPHRDIISQRIASLYRLPELDHGILVVPITTALHRLAPTRFLLGSSLVLDVGQAIDVEQMRTRLEASGYRCVDTVYEHGEFAVRGALIDLFPMGSKLPYRIDLFDDEIETLRTFDPETQRSIDKVDSVRLLPAREFPMQKDEVTRFKARFRERFDVDFRRSAIFRDLTSGIIPAGIEYYLPLFFEETSTLFDYLPTDTQVFSCRVSNRQPSISGTMCADATKSAAATCPAPAATGRAVPAGRGLLRPAQAVAPGRGQQRRDRNRRGSSTVPGASLAESGDRSQGQPATGGAVEFPRAVPRTRAVHRRIGRPPRSAAGTARALEAAPSNRRRLGRLRHRQGPPGHHHRPARRRPAAG